MAIIVNHRDFGEGTVVKIDRKKIRIRVDFPLKGIRDYALFVFDTGLIVSKDEGFNVTLNAMRRAEARRNPKYARSYGRESFFEGDLAEDISLSEEERFEALGYIAKNASLVIAQIPSWKEELFVELFGDQERTVHKSRDSGSRFRIHFARTENIPKILEENLVESTGGGMAISKSLFVEYLILNCGLCFGRAQDIEKMRSIAEKRGYLEEFERGLAR